MKLRMTPIGIMVRQGAILRQGCSIPWHCRAAQHFESRTLQPVRLRIPGENHVDIMKRAICVELPRSGSAGPIAVKWTS